MDTGINLSSAIEGLTVTELRQISDERGSVLHMLRCDAPDFTRFVDGLMLVNRTGQAEVHLPFQ